MYFLLFVNKAQNVYIIEFRIIAQCVVEKNELIIITSPSN